MRARGTGCRVAAIVVLLTCLALTAPGVAAAAPSCPATISISTAYDTPISIPLGCTDALTITYSVGTGPAHGTLGSFSNGAVVYTPSATFANQSDSFTVDATDPFTPSGSPTVIKVSVAVGSPAPPKCVPINTTTPYATPIKVTLECTGTGLAFSESVGPKHGSVSSVGGTVTYTPNQDFAGQDGFSYIVTDVAGQTAIASVEVTVAAPPKPVCPVVGVQTAYATATTVTLDCTGVQLSYAVVEGSGQMHGTVTAQGGATFTYTPNAGFTGQDFFQVLVTDFDDQSVLDTITVAVQPPPQPVCPGDAATTPYETGVTVSFSCTGTGLSYADLPGSGPVDGTLSAITANHVTYTPAPGFFGRDSFAVVATDAVGQPAIDTVTVSVGTPPPPACTGDAATAAYATATTLTFSCTGVGLSYSVDAGQGPADGTVGSFGPDGATYTPAAGFDGQDTFEILVTDVARHTTTDSVTVTVAPPPKPACSGERSSTAYQTPVTITLSCTGTGLSYAVLSDHGPADGTLGSFTGTQVTYVPATGFSGQDSFELEAIDAVGQTATDTVAVTVAAPVVTTTTTTTPTTTTTTPTTTTTTTTPAIVVGPPAVRISAPAGGAVYRAGQIVTAQFTCADAAQGPGIAGCTGTVADGSAIDTATPGSHSFTVTAVSRDGQQDAQTVSYTVLAPSNRFAVLRTRTRSDGAVSFRLRLPGPGVAVALETIWTGRHAAAGSTLPTALRRYVVARRRLVARHAGTLRTSLTPGASGRALVAAHGGAVVITLWVSYTPSDGTARAIRVGRLSLTR